MEEEEEEERENRYENGRPLARKPFIKVTTTKVSKGREDPQVSFDSLRFAHFFFPNFLPSFQWERDSCHTKSFSGEDQINIGERRKTGRQHTHKREKCEAPLPRRLVLPTSANSFPKNTFHTDFSSHTHMFSTRSLIM
jgi:hypothetical protein